MSRTILISLTCTLAFGLLAAGCGGKEEPAASDSGQTDGAADTGASDGTGGDGAVSDTGAGDAGVEVADTPGPDTTPIDTTPAGPTCSAALNCAAKCAAGDKACAAKCSAGASAADLAKFEAVAKCHVDLCGAVTEGALAEIECDFAKCFDKLDACIGFGQGESTCQEAVLCNGACVNGDAGCKAGCFQNASKEALPVAQKLRVCAAACPASENAAERAACVAKACDSELSACVGGTPLGCLPAKACIAHCHQSLPVKPNTCASTCLALSSPEGRAASLALDTCKETCKQAINPTSCWGEKCGSAFAGCYGTGGPDTCQTVDNCVAEKCEGAGSPFSCQVQCITKGKPSSQDAFVNYEGCVAKHMGTPEAQAAGCSFPYDLSTCVQVIKGMYCGNQSTSCFTDK